MPTTDRVTADAAAPQPRLTPARIGLVLGPLVALTMLWLGPPAGLSTPGWHTLAVLAWMVTWWVTEALPIAATSLLPIALFPLAGIARPVEAASAYADPIIFLFIGGFMIAKAVERWNLHERIALSLIGAVGTRPLALLASFALAAALLSMWISNTATALMLMPTALGVARAMTPDGASGTPFATALVLMVAYGCSIGGIGTPVGSPTNLVAVAYLDRQGLAIGFAQWMLAALPLMAAMLLAAWAVLGWRLRRERPNPDTARVLAQARWALGATTTPERRVLAVFALVAVAWMASPLLKAWPPLAGLNDTAIAILGVLALFALPAGAHDAPRARLLDWPSAERIPWGVALLFGGGLSVAAAMDAHGVSAWIGASLSGLGTLSPVLVLLLVATLTIFASEFMSNTATLAALLPVVGGLSLAAGVPPVALVFTAAMAASLAFMMPIGTPPNAIAYGTGHVTMRQMIRAGLWLNLVGIVAITAMSQWLLPWVIG